MDEGEPPETGRSVVERIRRARSRAEARIQHERERRYLVALAFVIADHTRQTAASVLAGALAFRFFLTLLPMTLVAVVGLGYLKTAGGTPSDVVKQFGIKGVLATTINQSSALNDPGGTAVLLLGAFGVFSGARTTTATLRAIHALAWGVPVVRWRRRGLAGMIFLGAVVVGFICAGLATRLRTQAGIALGIGGAVMLAIISAAIWLGASCLLPRRSGVGWRALVPGSILFGVGFALLQAITANWIGPKLDHESSLYGSLGVSFVVLGWLYVVGRLMVAAPLLNVSIVDHRRSPTRGDEPAEPDRGPAEMDRGPAENDREPAAASWRDAPPSPHPE